MADLFNAFKSALAQAGPGLVAQMQGKDQAAQEMYKAGITQEQMRQTQRQRDFSNDMKMQEMAFKIQQAKDSQALRKSQEARRQQMHDIEVNAMLQGRPTNVKLQQVSDTFNADTGNPTMFDPTRRENAIIDAITGDPVKKVVSGVQGRFEAREGRALSKDLAKEWQRQTPVKTVLNSLDAMEEILDRGEKLVADNEPIFGAKIGFTGKVRNALQSGQRISGLFEMDDIDREFENFNSLATQVLAQQVRSFTGAQATDAERQAAHARAAAVKAARAKKKNVRRALAAAAVHNAANSFRNKHHAKVQSMMTSLVS